MAKTIAKVIKDKMGEVSKTICFISDDLLTAVNAAINKSGRYDSSEYRDYIAENFDVPRDIPSNDCSMYVCKETNEKMIIVRGYKCTVAVIPICFYDTKLYEVVRVDNNSEPDYITEYDSFSHDDYDREMDWHKSYSTIINGETVYVSLAGTVRTNKEIDEIQELCEEGYYFYQNKEEEEEEDEYDDGERDNSDVMSPLWKYFEDKRKDELKEYRKTGGKIYNGSEAAPIAFSAYHDISIETVMALTLSDYDNSGTTVSDNIIKIRKDGYSWVLDNINTDIYDNRKCNLELCTATAHEILNVIRPNVNHLYDTYEIGGKHWECDNMYTETELCKALGKNEA